VYRVQSPWIKNCHVEFNPSVSKSKRKFDKLIGLLGKGAYSPQKLNEFINIIGTLDCQHCMNYQMDFFVEGHIKDQAPNCPRR
jgi:hypothetical protein